MNVRTLVSVRSSEPHLKCIRLASVRSSLPSINIGVRIELAKIKLERNTFQLSNLRGKRCFQRTERIRVLSGLALKSSTY